MTIQEFIKDYQQLWFEKPWYGLALKDLLDRVKDDQAHLKVSGIPSIASQGLHMISWQQYIIAKINKDVDFDIKMNSDQDWPNKIDSSWSDIKKQLLENVETIINLLQNKDDAFLKTIVVGTDYQYDWVLKGILNHDLYHTAQIVTSHKALEGMTK